MNDIDTVAGIKIPQNLLNNFFRNLINQFFKILPMKENNETSLYTYMKSLQVELMGCRNLIPDIRENPLFLTLLSILQYMIDNPNCKTSEVKREVFRAISICNKFKSYYSETEVRK